MRQIYVKEFGIMPGDEKETTLKLRKMLQEIRKEEKLEIRFEKGIYHFYPDYAGEKLLYISNHDEDTIKKVAFDLSGMKQIKISGTDTQFLFHTDILPFHIDRCREICIEGITIDYARTGYSEGKIVEVTDKKMLLEINREEYPYQVIHGNIFFEEENGIDELYCGCLEMDAKRCAPVWRGQDISFNRPYQSSYGAFFQEAGENLVEISLTGDQKFPETSRAGNILILRHHWRTYPCFYLTDSADITLRQITIYHCTGMAVISQFTKNITIEQVDIRRHPVKKRMFTATADGFHFVYADGKIQIKDCLVENQLDDPVNIHGIYGRIHKVLNKKEVIVELVEGMQKGVKLGQPGELFGIIDNRTMLEKERAEVCEVTMLNKDFQYIAFRDEMQSLTPGFVVENKSYVPDVLIEGCTFRNNRARGLLLTTAGQVIVRKNRFETPGAAILIEGDSNYWFESGATKYILLEENEFINCAYVPQWGSAPIQVSPSARIWEEGQRYHQYLEVRKNLFRCFDNRLIYAVNLETLIFQDNKIEKTDQFPPIAGEAFKLDGVLKFQTDYYG